MHGDDRRLRDLGVPHDRVLEIDRADPLATGLDQILGAIDQAQVAELGDRRDVAGAQPAVRGRTVRPARRCGSTAWRPKARAPRPRRTPRRPRAVPRRVSESTMRTSTPAGEMPAVARMSALASSGRSSISDRMMPTVARGEVSVMPHACVIGSPIALRQPSDSDFGTADPPQMIVRRADRCVPSSIGSMPIQIVGTPAVTVTRSDRAARSSPRRQVGSGHDQGRTGEEARVGRPQAFAWNIGTTGSSRSGLGQAEPQATCRRWSAATVERWE